MEYVSLVWLVLTFFLYILITSSSIVLDERDYSTTCRKIESQKKGRWFLYSIEPQFDGCTLKCVFLESSNFKYKDYFDKTVPHMHYFTNEEICKDANHFCSFGRCKKRMHSNDSQPVPHFKQFGSIVVEVGKGFMKRDDGRSKADPYIRFKFKSTTLYSTRVLKDTYTMDYNEEFVIPDFNINDNITVTVYDRDKLKDDWVDSFTISPKRILLSGMNGKFVEYPFGTVSDYIEIRLFWKDAY